MSYKIEYFHERVLIEVESWPVDILADYARLIELLAEHGPHAAYASFKGPWGRSV